MLKIFLHQMRSRVGDIEGNKNQIQKYYQEALNHDADIMLLPELAVTGYMSADLFLSADFISHASSANNQLIAQSGSTALIITSIIEENGNLYNTALVAQHGRLIGRSDKKHLVNYGVFDEKRYFIPGQASIIDVNGYKIAIPICEDIWFSDVCAELENLGAQVFLVPNASPYSKTKIALRHEIVKSRYLETQVPMIYCNLAIAHDGIVFDGNSFIYDGEHKMAGKAFAASSQLLTMRDRSIKMQEKIYVNQNPLDDIIAASTMAIQDYVLDNGFKSVLLGLSGGIDSALVAFLACLALGSENVQAYMLPSIFTSDNSIKYAQKLADNLQIKLKRIDIDPIVHSFMKQLQNQNLQQNDNSVMHQNLQSRVRGSLLMACSNREGSLLLTTGNKSEYATGYATLYGDMNGAFNPIKDLYKTEIYNLVNHINQNYNNIIPHFIIARAPSAELAPDQKDSDSLPEYEILDRILYSYLEERQTLQQLQQQYSKEMISRVLHLVKISEFKRHQSAPGVKLSDMHFDKDRRFPITNSYVPF